MAKCELEIILDQKGDIIRFGNQVGGTVRVDVNESCRCNKRVLLEAVSVFSTLSGCRSSAVDHRVQTR